MHALLRGLGMGGPASPFLWNLGFDPIIWALSVATGAPVPTYVDYLSALISGLRQMLEVQVLLVAIIRVAGLQIDLHHCQALRCQTGALAARRIARLFPITVLVGPDCPDSVEVTGFPAEFTRSLFDKLEGLDKFGRTSVVGRVCSCKVKTMVVPAHGLARWRRALAVSPFGSTAVVQQAPYLGVTVAVTALDGETRIPGRISKAAQDIIREGTFGQCLVRIRDRVLAVRPRRFPGHALWVLGHLPGPLRTLSRPTHLSQ